MRLIAIVFFLMVTPAAQATDDDGARVVALFRCSNFALIANKSEEQKRFASAISLARSSGFLERMLEKMRRSHDEIEPWYAERTSA